MWGRGEGVLDYQTDLQRMVGVSVTPTCKDSQKLWSQDGAKPTFNKLHINNYSDRVFKINQFGLGN